jgi:FkbM family methyltransferase
MKKIFLDCGAHDGCSVRKFLDIVKDSSEYEIHSFEPNPKLEKYHPVGPAIFHKSAVWTEDGDITFYNFSTTGGSSILDIKNQRNLRKVNEKPKWMEKFGKPEAIKVNSINLSNWIKDSFEEEDYIIIKMDIEGAEYAILQQMILDGTIEYVNELWIEWHFSRDPTVNSMIQQLTTVFNQKAIKLVEWDAMHAPYLIETNCSESPEF